jgi:tRNA threonylcarbamoyladenosine biosynthesis protein TsaE
MLLAGPILLSHETDTATLAARLAPRLGPGDTILLSGPLGAGKTAFARALIRTRLGDPEAEIPSPTYTLVQTYGEGDDALWHADLYRLSHPEEVVELGLLAAMEEAVCLIEWPDRLGPLVPATALHLELAPVNGEARTATLSGNVDWADRLGDLDD